MFYFYCCRLLTPTQNEKHIYSLMIEQKIIHTSNRRKYMQLCHLYSEIEDIIADL